MTGNLSSSSPSKRDPAKPKWVSPSEKREQEASAHSQALKRLLSQRLSELSMASGSHADWAYSLKEKAARADRTVPGGVDEEAFCRRIVHWIQKGKTALRGELYPLIEREVVLWRLYRAVEDLQDKSRSEPLAAKRVLRWLEERLMIEGGSGAKLDIPQFVQLLIKEGDEDLLGERPGSDEIPSNDRDENDILYARFRSNFRHVRKRLDSAEFRNAFKITPADIDDYLSTDGPEEGIRPRSAASRILFLMVPFSLRDWAHCNPWTAKLVGGGLTAALLLPPLVPLVMDREKPPTPPPGVAAVLQTPRNTPAPPPPGQPGAPVPPAAPIPSSNPAASFPFAASSGPVQVFDLNTGERKVSFGDPTDSPYSLFPTDLAVSEKYVLVGEMFNNPSGGEAHLFDVTSGRLLGTFENPEPHSLPLRQGPMPANQYGMMVAISDKYMLVGSGHNTVYIYSLVPPVFLRSISWSSSTFPRCAIENGTGVLFGHREMRAFHLPSGRTLKNYWLRNEDLGRLTISGNRAAILSDGRATIYHIPGWENESINSIDSSTETTYSPADPKWGSWQFIGSFNINADEPAHSLSIHENKLAVGGKRRVMVYDVVSGNESFRFENLALGDGRGLLVAIHGSRIVIGGKSSQ